MADQSITTRTPQQGDAAEVLLARILASAAVKTPGVALASAIRTTTTSTTNIDCTGYGSIALYFNITAVPGVSNLVLRVRVYDPASGQWLIAASSVAVSTVVSHVMVIGLGEGAHSGANGPSLGVVNMPLPDMIRIEVGHSTADAWTYSVGYCLIP